MYRSRMTASRPTLASIAAELGVSIASVSNALNRPERVSNALGARVRDVATRVGYAGPEAAARLLPGGSAETFGVLFTAELPRAFEDPAAVLFLQGLSAVCEDAGAGFALVPEASSQPGQRLRLVEKAVVDGFVVHSLRDRDPLLDAVQRRNLPTVVVDAPRNAPGVDWVGCDDGAASRALGRYLAEMGHRRIGIIAPELAEPRHNGRAEPERWTGSRYALMTERIEGLIEGLGLSAADVLVQERFEASLVAGADALHALLDEGPEITAVCALTDVLALGALSAAAVRGLALPSELTITGFDNVPEAGRAGLTTVSQPQVDKGRVAGELLLMAANGTGRRRLLPTHLQIRSSSGPVRGS